MKVLVTGASGFIGKNILLALPADWNITATYYRDKSFSDFLVKQNLTHVKPLQVDLTDGAALSSLGNHSYDACVYLAANGDPAYSDHAPMEDLQSNAVALLNVVTTWSFGHFIFFSSGAVYDGLQGPVNPESQLRPVLPYAISKWTSERYIMYALEKKNIKDASILRFFGAYGSYEPARKIYNRLIRQFAFEKNPHFLIRGDGNNLIDAMYIEDTVRAVQMLLKQGKKTQVMDLCSGAPFTLKNLVTQAAKEFGLEVEIDYEGEVPEAIEFRSNDQTMEREFGFKPRVTLSEGLQRFHQWLVYEKSEAGLSSPLT